MQMSDPSSQVIGVVGVGTMGCGIAQLFAEAGHPVRLFDSFGGAAHKARQFVEDMIRRAVDKGRYSSEQGSAIVGRITVCGSLGELEGCAVVIEAIIEELAAKQELFAALEAIVADDAILASNTSSLLIAELAARCRHPQRVVGLHFFNPVPLMKVVEVIPAVKTSIPAVELSRRLIERTGHRAVIAADQPGFLVNHAGRGLYTEGLRILEEQVASSVDVDILLREAADFRLGPFELLDLTGLDVSGKVMTSIYEQFHQEPRFRLSTLVPPRLAAGLLGRKSGEGWYRYSKEGRPIEQAASRPESLPKVTAGLKVWIDSEAHEHGALRELAISAGAAIAGSPAHAQLIIVQPWGWDASSYCIERGFDAMRCVAVDPLPGLQRRRTLMLTAITASEARDEATALLSQGGAKLTIINDSPGFVVQRVLATIINIAANIAQRGIASVADIDDAVRLGLGYPRGPLSWGDRIGGSRVMEILRNMQAVTGDPRYRPSPWLARRVGLGVSLRTLEAVRA